MSSFTVREVLPEDAADLARLSTELGYPTSPEASEHRLKALAGSSRDAVLVAVQADGPVIGWIHVFEARRLESDPFAEIGGLVVAEALRSRGIGSRLLEGAQDWARLRGLEKVRVRSRRIRSRAHGFYLRHGFAASKEQLVLDKGLEQGGGASGGADRLSSGSAG